VPIVLVRHGETEWSASGKHTSHTDLPLTEAGRRRAEAVGEQLAGFDFAAVFCSPLRRARETCALAGLESREEILDDLHEWDYGEYEGLTTPEIRQSRPDWNLWRDGCPGGEQPADVSARADGVLDRAREVGGDCVMFAHGHILRVIGARWLGLPPQRGGSLALSTASLSELGFEHENRVIALWNAT
jgi:probable phosphoglycerate mutase